LVQVFDLPLKLARFTSGGQRVERKLLGRLAPPAPLYEVETARDLAWRHRPGIGRRIVGGDERIDRFR
jgi:hypothetical protein